MNQLMFIKDYKHNDGFRNSFNELALKVFGIEFEDWYQKGFWNNRYIPFSYIEGSKVVANVSVNELDLVMDGVKYRAIQIGTVMTHPDYRNQGLAAKLMNKVLEEYREYEFMYLFANRSVLDFYPKFGFISVDEYQFTMDASSAAAGFPSIRKLDGTSLEDLNFIYQFATERIPVSQRFGTVSAQGILMFHCMGPFCDDVYYLEDEEAVVIFKREEERLDLFDIISKKEVAIKRILTKIIDCQTKKVVFHFTPDYEEIQIKSHLLNGDEVLFVRANGDLSFPMHSKHPVTSQA
ncbi:GNAT family N-acetyltransferase [Bacillus dakarensis]|uniref:GNAT family N-acetyltransferase n=1 Tax=Robertmurraya dakarensis TaxID=1926278 RepID=UPI000981AAEF|nr:GNAT family N-acetyltransferase [Bacillus dakarensis]